MKTPTLFLFLSLGLLSSSSAFSKDHDSLPRVLILGASNSILLTDNVRQNLEGEALVFRAEKDGESENCQGTTKGIEHIDRWLSDHGGKFDVITFNFGMHDLKRVDPVTRGNSLNPDHPHQAPPAVYEKQLREIVAKLKATGAQLSFSTTMPCPRDASGPYRTPEDVDLYNEIAVRVMQENGIPINDLFAFVKPRVKELLRPANVHLNEHGQEIVGRHIAENLRKLLKH